MPPVKTNMVYFPQNVDENHGDGHVTSLQDAFRKFRDKRKKELKAAVNDSQALKRSQGEKNILRETFIEQIKKYIGVPYARMYHDKDSPDYNSPLFLDCCGLVRRALKDLKRDFGFTIGHWNQAYMYDTLPITLREDEMKPGDLVFISGKYYGENRRKQIHNMVHVEMWLGEGEKTIGARWHRGRVQVHESYQFVSKSYYDMQYHFKSIETWLEGTCKSFCPEHPWTRRKSTTLGKKSIFSTLDMQSSGQQSDTPSESQQMSVSSSSSSSFLSATSGINLKKHMKRRRGRHKNEKRTPLEQQSDNLLVRQSEQNSGQKERCLLRTVRITLDENHLKDREFKVHHLQENCELGACQGFDLLSWEGEVTLCSENRVDQEVFEGVTDLPVQKLDLASSNSCELVVKGENFLRYVVPMHVPNGMFRSCPMLNKPSDGVYTERQQKKASRKGKPPGENRGQKAGAHQSSVPQITLGSRVVSEHLQDKTFFIGGQNGVLLVQTPLQSMGWRRIFDPRDSTFHLKWVECKSHIDYSAFREGQQMVNHIPNGGILTSKAGLRRTLEEHERVLSRLKNIASSQPSLSDFYPETYGISGIAELKRFEEIFKDGEVWICKPSGSNQGKGIFLVDDLQSLKDKLALGNDKNGRRHSERVIQRYIPNPLLLEGRKFDIRVYMLIASTSPYMIYYHKGYVRLSCVPFSVESPDIHAHLTNQYIQKKHPSYQEKKEETVWPFERFNEYVNVHYTASKGIPENWVLTQLKYRMKEIMLICFTAAKNKLERRLGFFDLLGFDFMVDDTMKVWLIEINVNPALHTNCITLRNLMPGLVDETLKVCIELFEKKRNKLRLRPVEAVTNFELLYNGETQTCFKQLKSRQPLARTRPEGSIAEAGKQSQQEASEVEDEHMPAGIKQSGEIAILTLENKVQRLSLNHSTKDMTQSLGDQ